MKQHIKNNRCRLTSPTMAGLLSSSSVVVLAGLLSPVLAQQSGPRTLEEITVTAQKREQSLQDAPVAVVALDSRTLSDLNVANFEDYVRNLPTLNAAGNGPGQSAFFVRGMATNLPDIGVSEIAGTTPTVALYLDEQPVSTISRNLDIYVADLERVEVLTGPQGTLFGASSEAGTIRLITNKPKLDRFSSGANLSYSFTKGGEDSSSVDGFINIPIIEDKLAIRAVVYNADRGGYIDNVPSRLTLPADNLGVRSGGFLTALANRIDAGDVTFVSASNVDLAEKDFNDASYLGGRFMIKYQANDDWTFLVQHTRQRLETEGVFADDVASSGDGIITDQPNGAGKYAVSRFYPDSLKDEFSQTSWTVEGRLGALEVLYTGAYLDRDVEQSFDYASYIKDGLFVAYYTCDYYGAYDSSVSPICHDPTYGSNMKVRFTRNTHEFRVQTPEEKRFRMIAGAFYDNSKSRSDVQYVQPGMFEYFADYSASDGAPPFWASLYPSGSLPRLSPPADATLFNPDPRPEGVSFYSDVTRGEKQIAAFGEASFDIIPDELTLTGGLRYYDMDISLAGATGFIFGTVNIDQVLAGQSPASQKDVIFKGRLSWTPNNDTLFYFTYSQGFRPGGFNRNGGGGIPYSYTTDTVDNYEIGWKLSLLGNRLHVNGSAYRIDWSNLQLNVQDPTLSTLSFVDNVGAARINGVEGDIAFAATQNLTLFGSFSYNDTKLTELPGSIINVAPVGSSLAYTPKLQFSARARYDWSLNDSLDAYVQAGLQHSGSRYNSIIIKDRVRIDGWTSIDLSAGVRKENWSTSMFVENLTNKRIVHSVSTNDSRFLESVGRPMTIGVRLSYKY